MKNVKLKKKIFDITLDILAWLSLLVAVILALAVFFSTFSGTENARSVFGRKMLIVNSDSMSKSEISGDADVFFESGDLIIIKEVKDRADIAVGDVISFVSYNPESNGETVTHKVRDIKTDEDGDLLGYETYGINTGVSDVSIVEPSAVIGEYVGKIPNIGSLFNFFKKPAGFFVSILIPCLLLLIFFSIKVGKQLARKEMSDDFNGEIENLKDRVSRIEKEGVAVQEVELIQEPTVEPEVEPQIDTQPQEPPYVEKTLDLTFRSLSSTIETLTHTIESLALTAEKPVETLSRTVEALAIAAIKQPAVAEDAAEQPEEPKEEPQEEQVACVEESEPEFEIEPEEAPELETECEVVSIDTKVAAQPQPVETIEAEGFSVDTLQMREKIPFNKRLLSLDNEARDYFGDVHNELTSYKKVKYRISNKGIFYRVGSNTVAKIAVRGKTLKLYIALNVKEYPNTVFFKQNTAGIKLYKDVLLTADIKSKRGRDNAIRLIGYFAKSNGLVRHDRRDKENIFKQLKLY